MDENKMIPAQAKNTEVEIDLLDLLNALKQHWLPIILVTIAGGLLALLFTRFLITPEYQSTSSIYVVSASAGSALNLSDLNFGTNLTNDYKVLVNSRTMMENVLANTGDNISVGRLKSMLSVGNVSGTRILSFTITSTDPARSQRLANAFAEEAIDFLPEVMGVRDSIPTVVDSAVLPTTPSNMNYLRNIAIGLLLGLVVIVAIYVIQYLLNDSFDSSDDVEKYLGIVPIAMVPENGQKHKGGGYYYYYSNNTKKGRYKKQEGKRGSTK
ncbi:MAG: capsular polysaccharide biosynthesis protein [Oscillospiraceae bacterium]|nr:capsular polysaccharide biosynthesis protein [Oscillospiraceae bacterium]